MHPKRTIYLQMKSLAEARALLFERFAKSGQMPAEILPVPDAVGRVLSEAVTAKISAPNFHAAAMDGIAVDAEDTFGASEYRPKILEIGRQAFFINTGHVMPPGTNAVIMIEQVIPADEGHVQIEAAAYPWQYVRKMGEDIVATELLFPQNHRITPYCIGALLSAGIFEIPVRRRPRILILPTGSELVDWRGLDPTSLKAGQVIESNSYVLAKLTEIHGGISETDPKLDDALEAIRHATRDGVEKGFDIVLIIGGSSAGSEDFARHVISDIGDVLVHGVTMMPGKPVIIGDVGGKPVFGIPGYPVSAIIAFEQFVRPLIYMMLGLPDVLPPVAQVVPTRKIASKLGVEEFVRVKIGEVGGRLVATPLPRGAGSITTITEADGILRIPGHVEGISDNREATAELLRPLSSIKNTIVIVGSHDNTLDVLADRLRAGGSGLSLSSSHVGSLGGLMAIRKGMCHLAGSHLLDSGSGTYNIAAIKRYLPDLCADGRIRLVNLVYRQQGLIIAPGNPKRIQGIEDLQRPEITMINRQAGSGTRILLDYRLKSLGIDPESLNGYTFEEFTHMSVAVAVLSGAADVGLGIYAAAKALGLEFIPVVTEQYDLVIPQMYFESPSIQILLDAIRDADFKRGVEALGGYSTQKTGEVLM